MQKHALGEPDSCFKASRFFRVCKALGAKLNTMKWKIKVDLDRDRGRGIEK